MPTSTISCRRYIEIPIGDSRRFTYFGRCHAYLLGRTVVSSDGRTSGGAMNGNGDIERIQTVIIGGGQAGLTTGYYLARRGLPFVILDANARIGDAWRSRWDSLRLFTPARYNGLAGMRFPAKGDTFPSKDEMADFLELYAKRFDLPVKSGVHVDSLSKDDDRFI